MSALSFDESKGYNKENMTTPRRIKKIRLSDYDYKSNGYYFVTIVSKQRLNIFKNRECVLDEELKDTLNRTEGAKLDYYVIMPNHIHLILILENSKLLLGEIIRRFKAKVSHNLGANVWQPNYYEHVIRNENALEKIREYIINNPQAEIIKFDQFYSADKSAGYNNNKKHGYTIQKSSD